MLVLQLASIRAVNGRWAFIHSARWGYVAAGFALGAMVFAWLRPDSRTRRYVLHLTLWATSAWFIMIPSLTVWTLARSNVRLRSLFLLADLVARRVAFAIAISFVATIIGLWLGRWTGQLIARGRKILTRRRLGPR